MAIRLLSSETVDGNISLADSKKIQLGSSQDLQIFHNGSVTSFDNLTGNLQFVQAADDADIIFQCDNGSGGLAEYFRVDGGAVETRFSKSTRHFDDVGAYFGDSADLQIYHDGSNSYIQDTATGNLLITSNGASVQINKGTTENMAEFIVDGAVNLYYNSAKKFETTSTGALITGDLYSGSTLAENSVGVYLLNTPEVRIKSSTEDGTPQLTIYNNNTTNDSIQFSIANNLGDNEIKAQRGNLRLYSSNTLALTLDTSQNATFAGQVIVQDNTSQPLSSLFEGTLVVQGASSEDPIIAVTDVNTANAAAGVFHQSSTSPGFPALVINAASNGSEQPLISARTNVSNTTGIGGTEVFAVDGDGDATFAGDLHVGGASAARFKSDGTSTYIDAIPASSSIIFRNSGSVEKMRILSNGDVCIGTTSPSSNNNYGTGDLNVENDVFASAQVFTHNSTAGNYSFFGLGKSSGTGASPTIVQAQETVGEIRYYGYDGNDYRALAFISADVDGTPGDDDMPGRIEFGTTSDGAIAPTTRMRIDSSGKVSVGSPIVGQLGVRGTTNDSSAFSFESANSSGNTLFAVRNDGLSFFPSGNVGIGTTSPLEKLNIVETTATAGTFFPVAISGARYQADYGVGIAFRPENNSSVYANKTAIVGSGGGYGYNMADLHFCFNNSTTVSDEVSLSDSKVVIKRSGNVGIGTDSPAAKLEIAGSTEARYLQVDAIAGFAGVSSGMAAMVEFLNAGDGNNLTVKTSNSVRSDAAPFSVWTDANCRFMILNSGNVGIGTNSPDEKLQIVQGGSIKVGDYLQIGSGDSNIMGAIGFNRNTTNGVIYNTNFGAFQIHNNQGKLCLQGYNASGTNQFQHEFLNNGNVFFDGNVGIGYTSPGYSLEIASSGSAGRARVYADGNGAIYSANGDVQLWTNNTAYAINFYSANKAAKILSCTNAGSVTVSGDLVAYGSPSDISLKENIKPIKNPLGKIKKLKGVTFDWKKSESILDIKEDYGFIAQDVKKVIPELVRKNENELLSMRHQGVIPILVEAIKEQQKQIDILQKEIETFKQKNK